MQEPKKALGIIPARFGSTRFPGKPLVDLGGKSMIRRVYEQVIQADSIGKVLVATDDARIADHVLHFGGEVILTRENHPSGTDRCAEVAGKFPEFPVVLNIQGDEPFLNPAQIDLVAAPLLEGKAEIATLARSLSDPDTLANPNIVKVVIGQNQHALYFSRSQIPFLRNMPLHEGLIKGVFFKHIGLYAFLRETLLEITQILPSPLEQLESLEQLRWLENGKRIYVQITEEETLGIDTPEDLVLALKYLAKIAPSGF